eukprot:GHVU01033821.1.p1 GENE.GHVU01033821.1~~GHVU01033821.1.p1  ORF type:complete len:257 (+),score=17.26 GHVU01033821.1:363-1133(+)
MSGQFKGAQLRWSTLEREAYAVRTVLLRFEFLFYRRKGIIILTDHRNLEFLLGKESKKDFPPYVKDKLYRWYLTIMSIPYRIRYLPGEANDWADLLSRWGSSDPTSTATINALEGSRLPWPEPDKVIFPSLAEIATVQKEYAAEMPSSLQADNQGVMRIIDTEADTDTEAVIWLPKQATDLIIRILVVAHSYEGLHCSQDATIHLVRQKFYWLGMYKDIRHFVRSCLHCLRGSSTKVIPRPLGETLSATPKRSLAH